MIPAPSIDYALISPLLIVFGVAVVGVLVEAFAPRRLRIWIQPAVAATGALAALVVAIIVYISLDSVGDGAGRGDVTAEGAIAVDGPGVVTWLALTLFAVLSFGLFAERRLEHGLSPFTGRAADAPGSAAEAEAIRARSEHTEVFPLAMFALGGMMLFATANDLVTLFVALEVLSLPLYVLCGVARRRRLLSQEAAMKYFLLGAFASALFLYGIALAYGFAGSFGYGAIDIAISERTGAQPLLLGAIALISVGLIFKIGAVPLHSWTPDVYQGAPTPVTAFMSAGTKAAAIIAFTRVLFVAFGGASWDWRPMIWVVALASMVLASFVAIAQDDVKRLLGWSAVAHSGFLMVAIAGAHVGDGITTVSALLFYLVAYGLASIGAFAVVTVVRDGGGETTQITRWAGLGRRSPYLASCFALFLLSFAGIPLTAGFMAKWGVFTAAWAGGYWPLVVAGVIMSAVAAVFYIRLVVVIFFSDSLDEVGPAVAVPSLMTTVVIATTAAATVVVGVVPGPLIDLAQHAGLFLR